MYRRLHRFFMMIFILNSLLLFADDASVISELKRKSYANDIELSTFAELQAWSERLGLEQSKSIDSLRSQLYDYYHIDVQQIDTELEEDTGQGLIIHIIHADHVLYSTYIVLEGAVQVEIINEEKKSSQTMSSDLVVINSDTNRICAIGNVDVVIEGDNMSETYTADSFIFTFDGIDGILVSATTRSDKINSDNETVEFYLTGDEVTIDNDTIILKNSYLTSNVEHSFYSLNASTMKVLPDGDWFLQNAVLRIGRVPILYLPFFYYPANTLFYHPSFGIDNDRGAFVNTTIFLLGEQEITKASDQSSFSSFMQMKGQEELQYVRTDGPILSAAENPVNPLDAWAEETGSYISLQFDAYQYHGVFLGIDSSFHEVLGIDSLSLYAALGYSDTGALRYILEPEMSLDTEALDLSLKVPLYSDPDIPNDMKNRNTLFDLDDLFVSDAFKHTYGDKDEFSWDLEMSAAWTPDSFSPFIKEIALSRADSLIEWDDYNPATGRYEIKSITLPDLSLTVKGTLFDYDYSRPKGFSDEKTDVSHTFDLSLPYTLNRVSEREPKYEEERGRGLSSDSLDEPFRSSYIKPVNPDQSIYDSIMRISFDYSIREMFSQDFSYDGNTLQYTDIDHVLTADMRLKLDLYDGMFTVYEKVKPAFDLEVRNGNTEEIVSYDESSFKLVQDLTVKVDVMNMTYQNRSYIITDGDQDPWIKHQLQAYVSGSFGRFDTRFSSQVVLPPLCPSIVPELSLGYDDIDVSVSAKYMYDADEDSWVFAPVSMKAVYDMMPGSSIGLTFEYDLEERLSSVLKADVTYEILDNLTFTGSSEFMLFDDGFTEAAASLTYGEAAMTLWFEKFRESTGVFEEGTALTAFKVSSGSFKKQLSFWDDRILLSAGVESSWHFDFLDYYDNSLDFSFLFDLSIAEFLDISLKSTSRNTATYMYFTRTGEDGDPGFFEDLLKSFNFFNYSDRLASNFNLDTIQISIVHYMQDWDFHTDINGHIGYNDEDDIWEWQSEVSVYLQWKAIPELDFEAAAESYNNSLDITVE